MTPKISLIIPTFQRPISLRRAISSAGNYQPDALEIIVIDDDPNMTGASIVGDFEGIRYFAKRGVDQGLSASRNIGLSLARGSHLIFLDDDDAFLPGAMECFLGAIDGHTSFYYADFLTEKDGQQSVTSLADLKYERLLVKNIIPVGAYMFQKSSVRSMFDQGMKSHEDWDFLLANICWEDSRYIPHTVVAIDKNSKGSDSMQNRRKAHFWMEYIGIYSKFPAPQLAEARKSALARLGMDVPVETLANHDTY